jgi:hypothetical protein
MTHSARHVVVLFHESDRFRDLSSYLVDHLAAFWREDGYRVTYLFGTRRFEPADLVLVHVNLSVVPGAYLEFAARYPIVLNGNVRDIRKSTISTNLVGAGDAWDGPVIAKSDLNYAGAPERFMRRTRLEHRWAAVRSVRRRIERLRGQNDPFEESGEYRVFDHFNDVPRDWLANRNVVIEKFRPEMENGLYHLRMYLFLGDRFTSTRIGGDRRVIKASPDNETRVEPAAEIIAWRKKFAMDYGKLDYVINNGEVVLLDVNKTIGASRYRNSELQHRNRRHVAEGLYACFS